MTTRISDGASGVRANASPLIVASIAMPSAQDMDPDISVSPPVAACGPDIVISKLAEVISEVASAAAWTAWRAPVPPDSWLLSPPRAAPSPSPSELLQAAVEPISTTAAALSAALYMERIFPPGEM
ncbi:hypothetical protein GCM10022245_73620 [Streptomyces mayteni]